MFGLHALTLASEKKKGGEKKEKEKKKRQKKGAEKGRKEGERKEKKRKEKEGVHTSFLCAHLLWSFYDLMEYGLPYIKPAKTETTSS